jgi:hypothetical protein
VGKIGIGYGQGYYRGVPSPELRHDGNA